MTWPLSQDYNEAIQSPATSFSDPELKAGQAANNALGIPQPLSGNFADVYEFDCPRTQSKWAIKCFTREIRGLQERYAEISRFLENARLPFAVEFHYLEQGIRIRGAWYPILKMRWVEGLLLNDFIRDNLDKPARLRALLDVWLRMAKRLREANLAHADLQHGNVILVPGSKDNSLAIKLIDYDGMFVPSLAGKPSGEVGHPNYQHPQRLKEGTWSPEVDRFPLLVVATALRALTLVGPKLWEHFDNGDNLLFKETDLRSPEQSPVFKELSRIGDQELQSLLEQLQRATTRPLEECPLLEEPAPVKAITSVAKKGRAAAASGFSSASTEESTFDFAGTTVRRSGRCQKAASRVPLIAGAVGGGVLILGLAIAALVGSLRPTPARPQPDTSAVAKTVGLPLLPPRTPEHREPVTLAKEVANSIGMKLVRIPPGTFLMGSHEAEEGRERFHKGSEKQHEVELTREFWLGIHEVTQGQFQKVMGSNPAHFSAEGEGKDKVTGLDTSEFPVENVSYQEALEFCKKLTERAEEQKEKRQYRLPTEAEWEHACRGGADMETPKLDASLSSTQANFNGNFPVGEAGKGNYLERTCRVGSYKPNVFGLYDMRGNVWEWCSDWFDPDYYSKSPKRDPQGPLKGVERVLRGGSWFCIGANCRSANRGGFPPTVRWRFAGFRVALFPSGTGTGEAAKTVAVPPVHREPLTLPKEVANSISMKLMLIPAGRFTMGSPTTETERRTDEKQHEVEITKAFYLGASLVTQKQFNAVMGDNPSHFCKVGGGGDKVKGLDTDDFPVETVSWEEAQAFCAKLSDLPEEKKAGRTYRLPSEAEWEYACRGGSPSYQVYHFGNSLSSTQANFNGNFPYGGADKGAFLERTCKAGRYPANAFGLFDMHGNLGEWCADWYSADYYTGSPRKDPPGPAEGVRRVVRGGCWNDLASHCRSASRHWHPPAIRFRFLGFRVALICNPTALHEKK